MQSHRISMQHKSHPCNRCWTTPQVSLLGRRQFRVGHTKLKFSYNLLHNSEETLNMHLQRQILNNKTFAYLAYKAGFFIHYISTMYQLQETY